MIQQILTLEVDLSKKFLVPVEEEASDPQSGSKTIHSLPTSSITCKTI